ncbi:SRPBCC domain-containing protein [Aeromicrobium sp. CF4.19]|uniref:SRPBCC family protein n=1 Tax=Aeromicrobium sp. CF4.19 TaxID=3373082 RepID=UPI003EE4DA44
MPVIDIQKDLENRTIIITSEFAAPLERVWELYSDPRQLEKVWGPPSHPATFVEHSLTPGAVTKYYMTGPEGEQYHGLWELTDVREKSAFAFRDAFATPDFEPVPDMPVSQNEYRFESTDAGTRMVNVSRYATAEALQQVLDMGVEEGARQAIDQIDDFLAA